MRKGKLSMKKRSAMKYYIAAFVMVVSFIRIPIASAFTGAGNGTEANPYLISNCAQFAEINNELDAHYRLSQSIDCRSAGDSIKVGTNSFTGVLDGGNHTLAIELREENTDMFRNLALFNDVRGEIKNIRLTGTVINDDDSTEGYTAALAANARGAIFSNVHSLVTVQDSGDSTAGLVTQFTDSQATNVSVTALVSGSRVGGIAVVSGCGTTTMTNVRYSGTITATGGAGGIAAEDGCEGPGGTYDTVASYGTINAPGVDNVGGLMGLGLDGSIVNSSSSMEVNGRSDIGGLVGVAVRYSIEKSSAKGTVNASGSNAGGLVGRIQDSVSSIKQSYATGDVTADGDNVGGLVGVIDDTSVEDSYARGDVSGLNDAGGFVGRYVSNGINRSYSTGQVDVAGLQEYGGLTGRVEGHGVVRSYWDVETSGVAMGDEGAYAFGEGIATADMKTMTTFTQPADSYAWDFDSVWMLGDENDGYPCLQWDGLCTGEDPIVDDNDGIPAAVEDSAPNNGDANNDGVKDSQQSHVASFINPTTGTYAAIELDDTCSLTSASGLSGETADADAAFNYQTGLYEFSADCLAESVQVKVYQFGITKDHLVLRKHIPTTGAFFTVDGAVIEEAVIGGERVVVATYTIRDNGELDLDPAVGKIADPVGLANTVGAPNTGLSRTLRQSPIASLLLVVLPLGAISLLAFRRKANR